MNFVDFLERATPEEIVPHRRGSFHEDWDDLLHRFAHRGTRAALKDQIGEGKPHGRKGRDRRSDPDPHQALFERAHAIRTPSTSREFS